MVKLSAFVCAHNEEKRLPACLERLSFCDEIIVVADRCTDRTEAVAREMGARVLSGIFPLEGDRRTVGAAACLGDWILEIDADEEVGPALAAEIKELLSKPHQGDWFTLPVDNYIGERLVRHGWGGSFGTSAVTRLYRRGVKAWGQERVHPTVRFIGTGGVPLINPLRHKVDEDISDMLNRLDRYTRLRAQDLAERGVQQSLWSNAFRGVRRFYKCYVSREGYREGNWGVMIALCAAIYPFLSVLRSRLEFADVARKAARGGAVLPLTPPDRRARA
ncbi:MAG: glycosyltransferase family 2 protein [Alphaproteobacteria bacterium]